MKKRFVLYIIIAVLMLSSSVIFSACSKVKDLITEYEIQYSYNGIVHKISVKKGKTYEMDEIPKKEGYVFEGLYDAEIEGTQYINKDGLSLIEFSDECDITLYPRFSPKEYKLRLDYQGAEIKSDIEYAVSYDEKIPDLPTNIVPKDEFKQFKGWFTQPNCGGELICDLNGVVAEKSILNSENYDLSIDTIYLYAGFSKEAYVISYTYKNRVYSTSVEMNADYRLDVPSKNGYNFLGFFNLPDSGIQYTDKDGKSLFPFLDEDNIELYPHFEAITYKFSLDFQGGKEIGSSSFEVKYDQNLPTLPTNVQKGNYEFAGWFTKPDCAGAKVADSSGLVEGVTTVNDRNFNLKGTVVVLYAGFNVKGTKIVHLYSVDGNLLEKITVAEGTSASSIKYEGIPVKWSNVQNGTEFEGAIEDNCSLYAVGTLICFDGVVPGKDVKVNCHKRTTTKTFNLLYSPETLKKLGFTKLEFKLSVDIQENTKRGCHKELWLKNNETEIGYQIIKENVGKDEWKTYNYTYFASMASMNGNVFSITARAEDKNWKDFTLGTVKVTVIASY